MRKVVYGKKEKEKDKIMSFLVATNVVASWPPKRRPTGKPHARAKIPKIPTQHSWILLRPFSTLCYNSFYPVIIHGQLRAKSRHVLPQEKKYLRVLLFSSIFIPKSHIKLVLLQKKLIFSESRILKFIKYYFCVILSHITYLWHCHRDVILP